MDILYSQIVIAQTYGGIKGAVRRYCLSKRSCLTSLHNYTIRIVSVDIREVIMIYDREQNR